MDLSHMVNFDISVEFGTLSVDFDLLSVDFIYLSVSFVLLSADFCHLSVFVTFWTNLPCWSRDFSLGIVPRISYPRVLATYP